MPIYPAGHTCPEEIRVYHEELDRAFSLAASGGAAGRAPGESSEAGRRISAQAREILLDEVILPYDRELGRLKKPDTTRGFATQAREAFLLWLNQSGAAPPATHAGVALGVPAAAGPGGGDPAHRDRGLGDLAARLAPDPARQTSGRARRPRRSSTRSSSAPSSRSSPAATSTTTSSTRSSSGSCLRHIAGGRGLPRALDPRLPRHEQRRRARSAGLRPGLPRLPEGPDGARSRIRRHRQAPRLHDLPRPELLRAQRRADLDELPGGSPRTVEVDLPSGPDAEEQEAKIREAQAELRDAVAGSKLLQERRRKLRRRLARTTASRCTSTSPIPWTGRSGASR